MRRLALALALALLAAAPARGAVPILHAHRGGSISFGQPDQYEDTLESFQRRIEETPGVWLEMDAGVSSDGVPFVMHDSTLDRTTDCTGALLDHTAAEIDACKVDMLGVQSSNAATFVAKPAGTPDVHVPRLAAVLALAKRTGAPVNLEIKRIPGDPHYTPGDTTFATHVMDVVKAANLDPDRLIMQSFDTTNLDVAKQELPGVSTSYLTSAPDPATVTLCKQRGYDYVSPGGVPDAATMAAAKQMGVKVVPYTLDTTADIQAAAAAGVDALITNDIPLARQALGLDGPTGASGSTGPAPEPSPAPTPPPPAATPLPVPPAGPSGPGAMTAARPLRLTLRATRRRAVLARGALSVRLSGPVGARVAVTVRARGVLLATRRVTLARSGGQLARVRLTARGRRLLRGSRAPLRVSVRAVAGGRAVTTHQRLR